MLTKEDIDRILRLESQVGSHDGACFGTPISSRVRPPTTPYTPRKNKSENDTEEKEVAITMKLNEQGECVQDYNTEEDSPEPKTDP